MLTLSFRSKSLKLLKQVLKNEIFLLPIHTGLQFWNWPNFINLISNSITSKRLLYGVDLTPIPVWLILNLYGAVGETRTPTNFRSHDSESCMSTNSITTAYWYYWVFSRKCFFSSLLHPKNIRKKVSKLRPLHPTNSQITDTFKDTFKDTP